MDLSQGNKPFIESERILVYRRAKSLIEQAAQTLDEVEETITASDKRANLLKSDLAHIINVYNF